VDLFKIVGIIHSLNILTFYAVMMAESGEELK